MATYLCVKAGGQTKSYSVKSSANKPYLRVSTGYIPLTTETTTATGLRAKVGGSVYRPIETYFTTINTTTTYESTYQTFSYTTETFTNTTPTFYDTVRFSLKEDDQYESQGFSVKYDTNYAVSDFSDDWKRMSIGVTNSKGNTYTYSKNTSFATSVGKNKECEVQFPSTHTLSNNVTTSAQWLYRIAVISRVYNSFTNGCSFLTFSSTYISERTNFIVREFTVQHNETYTKTRQQQVYYDTTREGQTQTTSQVTSE